MKKYKSIITEGKYDLVIPTIPEMDEGIQAYRVFYLDPDSPIRRDLIMGSSWIKQQNIVLDVNNIDNHYIFLGVVKANDMNDAYYKMQGEIWSPNGEARNFIKKKGLFHTSMSVGDVMQDVKTKKWYMVDSFGFWEIPKAIKI